MRSRGRTTPKPRRKPGPGREWWDHARTVLVDRSKGTCEAQVTDDCRRAHGDLYRLGMQAHHRKLRSQGGGHQLSNLVALCPDCHAWVHAHPEQARGRGLICPRGHDPAMYAVQLPGGRTVRLDGDGGYDLVWDDQGGTRVSPATATRATPYRTGWCGTGEPEWAHRRCREVLGGVVAGRECSCPCHTEPDVTVEAAREVTRDVTADVTQLAVPEAAIDAAAEVIGRANRNYGDLPVEAVYRIIATAALEAALPHLGGER